MCSTGGGPVWALSPWAQPHSPTLTHTSPLGSGEAPGDGGRQQAQGYVPCGAGGQRPREGRAQAAQLLPSARCWACCYFHTTFCPQLSDGVVAMFPEPPGATAHAAEQVLTT